MSEIMDRVVDEVKQSNDAEKLFTGERFMPGIENNNLEVEHFQRYLSVCKLVAGKKVLDAACGEGYGSRILADYAQSVTGIDIDGDTIERAKRKYGAISNLHFQQGSVEHLELEDHSLDIVISFETIEHVNAEIQKSFLSEIRRVLREDGILIMSTPNKAVYSDLHNYRNPFHIKEFYYEEYVDFLKSMFQNVILYNQSFEVVSLMTQFGVETDNIQFFSENDRKESEGKYFIAIASNVALPTEKLSSVYYENTNEYEKKIERILQLQEEEEQRNQHIAYLDSEIKDFQAQIAVYREKEEKTSQELCNKEGHIQQLLEAERKYKADFSKLQEMDEEHLKLLKQSEAHVQLLLENERKYVRDIEAYHQKEAEYLQSSFEKEERIRQLWEAEQKQQEENLQKQAEISRLEEAEQKQQEEILQKQAEIDRLKEEEQGIQQELRNKQGHIELLLEAERGYLREREANKQKEAEYKQTILNKEGHIEQLLEVEREYEREKHSRTYRRALRYRKISTFFFPVNSKRRFLAKVIAKGIKHPLLMLRMINLRRIKNFFSIARSEGMESVNEHFRLVEEVENSRLNPFDANKYQVTKIDEKQTEQKDISEYSEIVFEEYKHPQVSIVIPVYNQFDYTYQCLVSIKEQSGDVTYEILIADDCSTDLTQKIKEVVKGIKVIRNKNNLRFLRNCNNAAKYAKGDFILFLNNDTQVQSNWLQPLVNLMADKSVGMVGSKLVYADGWLQEAGGIVWNDASAWNYGNRKNPDDPEFNYVKEADYISGAAIMIRHTLWKEIGGFDDRFAPAYYEDTDLAFEVRKHGYKVMYQPLSVVIHFEGVSNGTDVTSGQKAYQVENQKKFYEKWKDVLEKEQFPNAENVFLAKDRSRFKKQILVVDHYVPHFDQDAGGKCTYMYLQVMVKMGFKVTFIGDNFFKHEPYTTILNQKGIEVLYGNYYYNNWEEWLKENLHYFDYVYLQRPHISIKYIDLVKQNCNAKVFYFAHDLHHIREMREYELTKDPEKLESANHWKTIEYELFSKADVGHVVGSYEQEIMQKAFPTKPIRNIPLYVYEDIPKEINKDFGIRNDLLYVGGFGHPPNADAVLWFAENVFPKILEQLPDMKWHVVGGKVPDKIQALQSEHIVIEGFLSDEELHKLYRSCRLAVVPLRYGAGVKGKVVESAYFQIPLVTTSIGAEGIDATMGNMLVIDDATQMADEICKVYQDTKQLKKMSDAGESLIKKYYTLEEAERVLAQDL